MTPKPSRKAPASPFSSLPEGLGEGAPNVADPDAVATAAALNVVEPYMSGLAGRGVATCYIASEKRVRTLDFVGPISKNFPVDKLSNRSQLQRGALANLQRIWYGAAPMATARCAH